MNEQQTSDNALPDEGVLAVVVESGWVKSDFIPNLRGDSYRLLTYEDGTVRFEHRCDRGHRGVIICAPAIHVGPHGNGHTLIYTQRQDGVSVPTVNPSIDCEDCGTHGFIQEGRWIHA